MALRTPSDEVEANAEIYRRRRDVLVDGLNRIGWKVQKPKGTMFVWAPIPDPYRHLSSMDFAMKQLDEAEVCVSPGAGFGHNGEGYVRIALVENENRLRQSVRQIGKLCSSRTGRFGCNFPRVGPTKISRQSNRVAFTSRHNSR